MIKELNIRDYWRIIVKRRVFIIVVWAFVIFVTAIYVYTQPKIYEARATVKIEQMKTLAGMLLENMYTWTPGDILSTETNVIKSWPVAEKAAKALGLTHPGMKRQERQTVIAEIRDSISTRVVSDTSLIEIIIRSSNPERAVQIGDAVAESYIQESGLIRNRRTRQVRTFLAEQLEIAKVRLVESEKAMISFKEKVHTSEVSGRLSDKILEVQEKLALYLTKYTEKHPFVIELKEQISDLQRTCATFPAKEVELARLQREFSLNEKNYATLKEKLESAQIAEAENIGEAVIVNPAVVSDRPLGAGMYTNLFLGIILGAVLGVMMGFVTETLDTSFGAIDDVEESVNLPVLAVIPHIKFPHPTTLKERILRCFIMKKLEKDELRRRRMIVHYAPSSINAEAYRTLRTEVKISEENKVILVTSTAHEEGKTSVAVNLAITLAQAGIKSVILGADLRRPSLGMTFGLKQREGLADVLAGEVKLEDAITGFTHFMMGALNVQEVMRPSGLDYLYVVPEGKTPSYPAELIHSARMKETLFALREQFSAVIIDSPPVIPVTDPLLIAPLCDTTIIVYQAGRVSRFSLIRTKKLLVSAGAKIKGVVLNHVQPTTEQVDRTYPYYYY